MIKTPECAQVGTHVLCLYVKIDNNFKADQIAGEGAKNYDAAFTRFMCLLFRF